jgi:TP901 family phage tail tape measure protein
VADLRLGVKIGVQGGAQSAKEIKNLDDQVKRLQDQNAKAASTAKALGAAYNLSGAEVDQLINELRQLEGQTQSTAGEARKLDAVFQGLLQGFGQQLTQIGFEALRSSLSGVIGVVQAAAREFGSFDQALTEFDAKSTASAEQIQRIGEQSKDLAAITSQSPAGVAALSTALLTLGATADQVEENLKGITFLADVLGEDPVLTGQVIQTGLNIWGEFGETADGLADKINFLINSTAAGATGGVGEFFQLFADVGGIVKSTGAEFDDLASAFAVLRNGGASASIAATGIKTALLAVSAPTSVASKELEALGVSAFDAEGNFIGLGKTLELFSENLNGVSEQKRLELATTIFGREGAPAFLQALGEANGSLSQIRERLGTEAPGSLAESLEIINQSLPRQAELLTGAIDSVLTSLGESLAPIQSAILGLSTDIIESFSGTVDAENSFNLLAEAGQRLQEALDRNPEVIDAIAQGLAQLTDTIISGIVFAVDTLSNQIDALDPQSIQAFINTFAKLGETLIQIAGQSSQLAGSLAEVGASFAGAGASVFSSLAPTFIALNNVINGAVQALQPLLANTQLVEIAFQALLIRMVAIKAVGLANSFIGIATGLASLLKGAVAATASLGALNVAQATGSKSALLLAQSLATSGASATTAALGFKAAAASAAAAAGPFVALAAAIATANLIKTTQELRFTNDELEAFANGVEVAASQGFNFANKLNSINDSIAAAGGKATAEQRKQLQEYVNLSKGQIEELKRQLTEVQSIEPKNDSQRNAQQNLTNQLQTTIGALEKQITEADGALTQASSGLGDKAGKAFSEGVKEGVGDGPQEAVKSALDGIKDEVDASLSDLELAAANTRATILEAGGDPAKLAQAEQQALKDRIDANKDFLAQLKALTPAEGEDAQKTADQIRQTELTLANDRVALAQQVLEAKVKAAEDAAKAEVDRLKEARDTERESAQTEFDTQQEQARKRFGDEDRARQEAFDETQQNSREAFNESQRDADEAFQLRQQNAQKAFQKAQQAEAKRFQDQLNAERDRGNREFDALQKEVDRRAQLAEATGAERADLQRQFEEEDRRAKERRKIEQQVLNQRGSVLADQGDLLNLSPLEQARAAFEQSLQEKQVAFDEQQQIAQEAFEVRQRADQKIFEDQQKEDQRLFDKVQREDQKLFETSQQVLQEQFQSRQQAAEAAFNAQQRQLDEQSAQRQAAILEAASRGIAPQVQARRDGGPVAAGQPYLVGEEGPELITPTRRGWVHTAGETAAIMARQPVMAIKPQSIAGVEAKLSELLQEVRQGRRVVAPTSFTLNTQNPLSDAVELQIKQVRALARGRVL